MSLLFWCIEIQVNKFHKANDIIIPRACNLQSASKNQSLQFTDSLSNLATLIVWFQKTSILPPQKGLEIPGRRGVSNTKDLKQCMKLNWNFRRGGGTLANPFHGGVWIFSGTTHWLIQNKYLVNAQKIAAKQRSQSLVQSKWITTSGDKNEQMANTPVLPAVPSTTVPPGFIRPDITKKNTEDLLANEGNKREC